MNNMIFDTKVNLGCGGYVDKILKLNKGSRYDYIHDSYYLRQGSDLAYIFKMFTVGPGSGVDLIRRKVMTIYCCDMKSEMVEHQKQMWLSLISVMEKHGIRDVNFTRFMADSAQANFNAMRGMFGFGDKSKPMVGKEKTYQFHLSQTLDRHTKQFIKLELQDALKRLCHEYRLYTIKDERDSAMEAIRAWWFSCGAVSESGLKELNDWLNLWHFRFHQWGSIVSEVHS